MYFNKNTSYSGFQIFLGKVLYNLPIFKELFLQSMIYILKQELIKSNPYCNLY